MIKIETIQDRIIKVSAIGKLEAQEIEEVAPQIDRLMEQFGHINILVDARQFDGWANVAAFKYHINFIKSHYYSVGHVAVVMGHFWQKLVLSVVKMALKKDIKTFKAAEIEQAIEWIVKRSV